MPTVGGPSSACVDSGVFIQRSGASASIFRSAIFIVCPCSFLFLHSETVFYAQSLVNPSPRQSERSAGDAWEAARPEEYSRHPAQRRHDAKTMGRSVKAWDRRRDDHEGPWLTFNPCGPTIEHSFAIALTFSDKDAASPGDRGGPVCIGLQSHVNIIGIQAIMAATRHSHRQPALAEGPHAPGTRIAPMAERQRSHQDVFAQPTPKAVIVGSTKRELRNTCPQARPWSPNSKCAFSLTSRPPLLIQTLPLDQGRANDMPAGSASAAATNAQKRISESAC
jgi:hypothetical protein